MSRIGNAPITLKDGVEVNVTEGNVVSVKGPKGELSEQISPDLKVKIEDGTLTVERPTNQKRHKAMHGLYRTLINNMVVGVSDGFKKQLELIGVGFRAKAAGQILELSVGFSHPVLIQLPEEVTVSAEQERGKNPIVSLECIDKQLIGEVAAKIRSIRKPEPYKGKGIRYVGEYVRKKAGKSAAAAG